MRHCGRRLKPVTAMTDLRPALLKLLAEIDAGTVHGVESTGSKYALRDGVQERVTPQVEELMAHELAHKGAPEDGCYPVLLTPAGELELKKGRDAT